MSNSLAEQIKLKISQIPQSKLVEIDTFIDTLLSQKHQEKKSTLKMEGIWKDIGFENIDIEKELSEIRIKIS